MPNSQRKSQAIGGREHNNAMNAAFPRWRAGFSDSLRRMALETAGKPIAQTRLFIREARMMANDPWPNPRETAAPTRVDCAGLNAGQVLLQILPSCLEAKRSGTVPFIIVSNLERLEDSVTRLLKSFDRLAEDFDARILMSESSGFGTAFFNALAGAAHVELRDGEV